MQEKPSTPQKILIVRMTAIGDVAHVLPALNALRLAMPDARIDWLVDEIPAQILMGHPQINHLQVLRRRWRKEFRRHFFSEIRPFFRRLRAERYDWAIDFQGLTKSGLAAYFSGARRIIGFGDRDGRELNKLFTNVKVRPRPGLHIVEKNISLLAPLGIENPPIQFVFPDFEADKVSFDDSGFYAAVNPGAGWQTKRLPVSTLAALCARLNTQKGMRIVITWGPGEEELYKDLLQKIAKAGANAEMSPPTTLRQLARLISRAGLFIGGDTGPSHIAAALGIPTISFFGASDAKRNRPYGEHCNTIQNTEIPCIPCWKTRCRFKDALHLACSNSITAGDLYDSALRLLESKCAK